MQIIPCFSFVHPLHAFCVHNSATKLSRVFIYGLAISHKVHGKFLVKCLFSNQIFRQPRHFNGFGNAYVNPNIWKNCSRNCILRPKYSSENQIDSVGFFFHRVSKFEQNQRRSFYNSRALFPPVDKIHDLFDDFPFEV